MRSPNKVTALLVTAAAALGSVEAAQAKSTNKAPRLTITRIAKAALSKFEGADNANFLSNTHKSMFFDYVNSNGSITEVTIKSSAAKNGYPDPQRARFVDATTFFNGLHPGEGGVAPLKQLTVSKYGSTNIADKADTVPSEPQTMNVIEARVGYGVQDFDHVYSLGQEGEDELRAGNYYPGVKRAQHVYSGIARELENTIQHLGE